MEHLKCKRNKLVFDLSNEVCIHYIHIYIYISIGGIQSTQQHILLIFNLDQKEHIDSLQLSSALLRLLETSSNTLGLYSVRHMPMSSMKIQWLPPAAFSSVCNIANEAFKWLEYNYKRNFQSWLEACWAAVLVPYHSISYEPYHVVSGKYTKQLKWKIYWDFHVSLCPSDSDFKFSMRWTISGAHNNIIDRLVRRAEIFEMQSGQNLAKTHLKLVKSSGAKLSHY